MIDWKNMFTGAFENTLNGTHPTLLVIFTLLFLTILIVIYSVFVYYFYHFLARKDIVTLNLSQFNSYSHPMTVKLFAVMLYILEFIILLPIVIFLWFAVLSIFILVMSEGLSLQVILLISAALVASVRVTSYISESLSKDLAKLLPLTLLAIAITRQGFFNLNLLMDRVREIPDLFTNIIYFLAFIIIIEIVMRFIDLIKNSENTLDEESESN